MINSKKLTIAAGVMALAVQSLDLSAATLRIDNGAEPGTLDPHQSSGTWESRIIREMFETLVSHGPQGELVPGLAERWEISDDGTTLTFHLREEAQWSDGEPITAEDAVFSLRRLLQPAMAAYNANLYYPIEGARAINSGEAQAETLGVEALDDHTLRIHLVRPTAWFMQALAMNEAAPLPEHYLSEHPDNWIAPGRTPVSGPFSLSEWVPQDHITLSRNPAYFAADSVALDEAVFYPIEDANSALNRYRAGSLDISYSSVPSQRFDWVQENLPEALRVSPFVAEYFYMFNLREESPFSDVRVREALNLATRREVITEQLLGMGQIPSSWLVPRVTEGGTRGQMAFADMSMDARMARARELMQAAGYGPGNPLQVELRYNTLEDHKRIAVALAAMWKPLGVDITLNNSEAATHYAAVNEGNFELARYGMVATINDPYDFLGSYATDGSAARSTGYHNAAYDELVTQSSRILDDEERARVLTQAQQTLLDDYALLPLYDYVNTALVSPRVSGWHPTPMNVHPLRYVSIEE
ncbi:peptide ABC transporter substrate-binding protein [Kushneria aurantia]|uniref:Peptide ABC transporter substrate-binding protein n=1 Tax=Kushneria aurantia TaxID=504092 RepID=A0ABV6G5R3_9GAMM|nr:peptide ABC transporter substrate-binding protein [Kushneria aurantia]